MIEYTYDTSFEGLLTAFSAAIDNQEMPHDFVASESGRSDFLFDDMFFAANSEKAQRLLERLRQAGGGAAVHVFCRTFLADRVPDRERILFDFLRLTLEQGRCVNGWDSHPVVNKLLKISRKVGHEIHRFTGMLRFMKLEDGTYYAPFEPDHNIFLAVARHFSQRLPDQRWVLHDCRRCCAAAWDLERILTAELPKGFDPSDKLAEDERFYQDCWRRFFDKIAIEERINPKLQRQFLPRRYWKHLTEMNGGSSP